MGRIARLFGFLLVLVLVLFVIPGLAMAQTPAPAEPQYQTFSITTSVVSLPSGKHTFAGVDSGMTFSPTPNFDLLERNLIATGAAFSYYGGGFNYRIKPLSVGFNNLSPNVNGLRVQFGITGSAGVVRLTPAALPAQQHVGFTGGGFVNYSLSKTGSWTLGAKVEYAKFPGYANNTWIAVLNPAFHF